MIYIPNRARQQGSIFVLVMAVASIVGVIGFASLQAVRLQHRDSQIRGDASRAQTLTDAGLKVIHARLSADADWRTRRSSGAWSTAETLGDGAMSYALIDDDGDLADDADESARLIVRVACGDAVRLASIRVGGESARTDPGGPLAVIRGSYRRELDATR